MTPSVIAWIERTMGPSARVVRVDAMRSASTDMHLVEVKLEDGSTQRLVTRIYSNVTRRLNDPWYVPAREEHALRLLAGTAVPAPRLYAADLESRFCSSPALLESWIPGEPAWQPKDLDRYLTRAAEVLVEIHGLLLPDEGLARYAPYSARESIKTPSFSTRPGLWERVANALDRPRPAHRETFIHRDYHPGNVLWDGTRVTGVVDWATAAWGPPGIDLARMRLNLASHHGKDFADQFVAAYVAAGGDPSAHDPFWDLLDAGDVVPDLTSPDALAGGDLSRFEDYVEGVLALLR